VGGDSSLLVAIFKSEMIWKSSPLLSESLLEFECGEWRLVVVALEIEEEEEDEGEERGGGGIRQRPSAVAKLTLSRKEIYNSRHI
jgi:hypothetical protein